MASGLPDELWRKILELGIGNSKLIYRDLCCISISSRRLNRLSKEDSLWVPLLTLDFPLVPIPPPPPTSSSSSSSSSSKSPYKTLYKSCFEKDRERKLAAHRRALLRIESQIAVHATRLRELEVKLMEEKGTMKAKLDELSYLHKQRTASVAVKVWQPEIVRDRQKQMVEQSVVPVQCRISSVEMEIRLCKQQIAVFDKTHCDEERRLNAAKEQLALLKYHPLHDHSESIRVNESMIEPTQRKKRESNTDLKKLKQYNKNNVRCELSKETKASNGMGASGSEHPQKQTERAPKRNRGRPQV